MVFLLSILTNDCMDDSLKDILLGNDTFHVLNEVVGLRGLVILEVVNHEVESCLWDHIDQWRQYLQSILTTSEDHQVMPQEIVVLEHISSSRRIL